MIETQTLSQQQIQLAEQVTAHNYHPLPVVIESAEGAWVTDVDGRRYLDCLAGYSALNFGHGHPVLLAAAREQMDRVTLTSRAFHTNRLGPFCRDLAALAGMEVVLPMNTGAEAVETAIKVSRKWGYDVKGVAPDQANIIVFDGNFHGRTTTIVSFSTDPVARDGFGPFTPGFRIVPYGDAAAVEAAIDANTVAVLVEPIQGEAGVIVPPPGFFTELREWCTRNNILLIIDEVQSGLGRTGRWFAFEHEGIRPDALILGKALGGGLLPVSAFLADDSVMDVFDPGSHGSTFGGNALAAAVALEALQVIEDEGLVARSAQQGEYLLARLREVMAAGGPLIRAVRGRGLWAGVDIDPAHATARELVERLAAHGVLSKETHETVIRFAPPLTITRPLIDRAVAVFRQVVLDKRAELGLGAGARAVAKVPEALAEPAV